MSCFFPKILFCFTIVLLWWLFYLLIACLTVVCCGCGVIQYNGTPHTETVRGAEEIIINPTLTGYPLLEYLV